MKLAIKVDVRLALMAGVTFAAVTVAMVMGLVVFGPLKGVIGYAVSAGIGGAVAAFVIKMPKLMAGKRGSRIDNALPFFITHFGVLATSNLPRTELLRILAENKEYKEIAAEMGRVLQLTTEWGLGLSDAVRAVADTTPSKTFSAFLLRLAHSLESGQALESFLMSEQVVVMGDYESLYSANLLKVDAWKEMYTNSIMTIGFLSVFASVLPLLVGGSTVLLTAGIAGFTLVLEVLMGVTLQDRLPSDKLSPNRPIESDFDKKMKRILMISGALSVVLGVTTFLLGGLGLAIVAAVIPLGIPGYFANKEEQAIRQREYDYPAFIRSLGAAAAARGGAIRSVLGNIQANNLGALTIPVRDLHRRLTWKVDDRRTWRAFGEQTASRLIDSFTEMFVEAIGSGGKPAPISHIISDNMLKILALRTTRRATAGTFRSALIGIGVGLAVVLFMGSGIFGSLTANFATFSDVLESQGLFHLEPPSAHRTANLILYGLMVIHGVAAGLFYKLVEGGRIEGAAMHMAINIGAGVLTGYLMLRSVPSLLNFGG